MAAAAATTKPIRQRITIMAKAIAIAIAIAIKGMARREQKVDRNGYVHIFRFDRCTFFALVYSPSLPLPLLTSKRISFALISSFFFWQKISCLNREWCEFVRFLFLLFVAKILFVSFLFWVLLPLFVARQYCNTQSKPPKKETKESYGCAQCHYKI